MSTASAPLARRLQEQLRRATEQWERIDAEYETLINDPDAIQEDRDAAGQARETAQYDLTAAQDAVARLEAGTYGVCEHCGTAISEDRLEAVPDTRSCVACQSTR